MSDIPAIRLPAGVRDFLPRAAAWRRKIAEALLGELERWGYERVITPVVEYDDVLARGLGADARAAALRFVEPGTGEVVAIRPDITPQIARMCATRLGGEKTPLRLCYEGSVLRLAPGAHGQKELIQAGVELVGAPSPEGDAEVIALAGAALAAASIDDLSLDVGHAGFARLALGESDAALRELVARKDSEGVAAAARHLPPRTRKLVTALPSLYGEPAAVLERARALPLTAPMKAALAELERALELVVEHGWHGRLTVDLGDVRGFEYYTGLRFCGYVTGVGDAVVRGGRYDDLIARYGASARATGFAVDVEAIAQAEQARGDALPVHPRALIAGKGAPRVAAARRAAGAHAAVHPVAASARELADYAAAHDFLVVLDLDKRPKVTKGALAAALAGKGKSLARELGLRMTMTEQS